MVSPGSVGHLQDSVSLYSSFAVLQTESHFATNAFIDCMVLYIYTGYPPPNTDRFPLRLILVLGRPVPAPIQSRI